MREELTGITKDREEVDFEASIRPRSLKEYVGQDALKENLDTEDYMALLNEEMIRAAGELRFEDAAVIRDEMYRLKKK